MSVGCPHNPDNACADCLKAMSGGQAAFFATHLKPQEGESLAQFQARVQADDTVRATGGTPPAEYVEPSLVEQKRIIKDPSVPEVIRRYWRERLYGKGGTGRKGIQQERAQRATEALNANFKDRTLNKLVAVSGNAPQESVIKHLSGKQRKRARRLLRQMSKAIKSAA